MTFMQNLNWTPTIGDPTVWGWITVLFYLIVICLIFKMLRERDDTASAVHSKERTLWSGILFFLIVLGINKQLDLQTLIIEIVKSHAHSYNWYHDRRYFQTWFISIFIVVFFMLVSTVIVYFRLIIKRHLMAIIGMLFLGSFVLIRATSIHKMDQFISMTLLGTKINFIFEMAGLILIALNALYLLKERTSRQSNIAGARD